MRLARIGIVTLLLIACNSILDNQSHYFVGADAGTSGSAGVAGMSEGAAGPDASSGASGALSAGGGGTGGVRGEIDEGGEGGETEPGVPGNPNEVPGNLLLNGDFSSGLQNWNIRNNLNNMPGTATVSGGQACITLTGYVNSFSLGWPNDSSMALSLAAGVPYALSFQVSTTESLQMFEIKVAEDVSPFPTIFAIENETPDGTLRTYAYPFRLSAATTETGVAFNFASMSSSATADGTICFANVAVVSLNEANDTEPLPSVAAFIELTGGDAGLEQTGATVYTDGTAEILTQGSTQYSVRSRYAAGSPVVQQFLADLDVVGDISKIQTFPGCTATDSAVYVSVGRTTSGNLLCPPTASAAITALANDAQTLTATASSGGAGGAGIGGLGGAPGRGGTARGGGGAGGSAG